MYRVTGPDNEIYWNESHVQPIVTLADGEGGRAQIVLDDHCYVILLQKPNGKYRTTAWICKAAHQALKNLPDPE